MKRLVINHMMKTAFNKDDELLVNKIIDYCQQSPDSLDVAATVIADRIYNAVKAGTSIEEAEAEKINDTKNDAKAVELIADMIDMELYNLFGELPWAEVIRLSNKAFENQRVKDLLLSRVKLQKYYQEAVKISKH